MEEYEDRHEEWQAELESEELYDADPNCKHEIYCAPGGRLKCSKCSKCSGWFCY